MEKQRFDRALTHPPARRAVKFLSSLLYIGYLPLLGGTFASLLACLIYYYLFKGNIYFVPFTIFVCILAFPLSGGAEKIYRRKDPKEIVIDDFSGMCIALISIPRDIRFIFISFFLFRLFDALKITPINKIERLPSFWGIVGDDILAGIYANICLQIVLKLTSIL